jgi:hypothetical protein
MDIRVASDTTFSGKNIGGGSAASPVSLGSITLSADVRVQVSYRYTGLNGAAASITTILRRKNGSTVYQQPKYSDTKLVPTDTVYGDQFIPIFAANGDTVEVLAYSSNASDSSAGGTLEWINASHADVNRWRGTDVPAPATAGYPVVIHKSGTGTGELSLSNGIVRADDRYGQSIEDAAAYGVLGGKRRFVSTAGSDANIGTSQSPKLTLQATVTASSDGDFITIANGNFNGLVDAAGKVIHLSGTSRLDSIISGTSGSGGAAYTISGLGAGSSLRNMTVTTPLNGLGQAIGGSEGFYTFEQIHVQGSDESLSINGSGTLCSRIHVNSSGWLFTADADNEYTFFEKSYFSSTGVDGVTEGAATTKAFQLSSATAWLSDTIVKVIAADASGVPSVAPIWMNGGANLFASRSRIAAQNNDSTGLAGVVAINSTAVVTGGDLPTSVVLDGSIIETGSVNAGATVTQISGGAAGYTAIKNIGSYFDPTKCFPVPTGVAALNTFGRDLALSEAITEAGTTIVSATSTTVTVSSSVTSYAIGSIFEITSGTGANQARVITAVNTGTKTITVGRAWDTTPTTTSTFRVKRAVVPVLNSSLQVQATDGTGAALATAANQTTLQTSVNALPSASTIATAIWAATTRTLSAISDSSGITTLLSRIGAALSISGGKVAATVATGDGEDSATALTRLGTPAGASLSADIAGIPSAVWAALTSALTTTGSIGKRLADFITTLVYAAPPTAAQNRQEMDSNSTQLAKLGTPAGASISADIATKASQTSVDALTGVAGADGTTQDKLDQIIEQLQT